jgi:hypothetical protein
VTRETPPRPATRSVVTLRSFGQPSQQLHGRGPEKPSYSRFSQQEQLQPGRRKWNLEDG